MSAHLGSAGAQVGILLCVSLPFGACGLSVPPPDRVAEIEGQALSNLAFEEFLERHTVEGAGVLGSDVLSSLLDQFLDEQLLARLAGDRLGAPAGIDARAAAQALLESVSAEPDDAAVAGYYRQNLPRFDLPERVLLRQLLFTDRETADRIRNLWSVGKPYKAVVEELAQDPTAHVGEEGEFSRQGLPPVFADSLFALKEGEVSEVLPADYGFHVFQVVRHLEAGVVPLEDAFETLRQEMASRRREDVLSQLAAEARRSYNVRVFERNLPFNYSGRYGSNGTHESS